jgi:hypothetical protein
MVARNFPAISAVQGVPGDLADPQKVLITMVYAVSGSGFCAKALPATRQAISQADNLFIRANAASIIRKEKEK